jgi:hypothetical protein
LATLFLLGPVLRSLWRASLVVGSWLGVVATRATRDAGRRPIGTFLAALGYLFCIVAAALLLAPSGDVFILVLLLPVILWLLLSSRAGRRRRVKPDEYRNVFE